MRHSLLALAALALALLPGSSPALAQPAPSPVKTASLRLAHVPVALEGIGTVQATSTVALRPQVDRILQEIRFLSTVDRSARWR